MFNKFTHTQWGGLMPRHLVANGALFVELGCSWCSCS